MPRLQSPANRTRQVAPFRFRSHASAGSVFNVRLLSGLLLSYMADKATFSDSAGTIACNDSDGLSNWKDQSPNATNAINSGIASTKHIFKVNQRNGLPAIVGQATQNFLNFSPGIGLSPGNKWTVWAAANRGAAGNILPVMGATDDGSCVLLLIFSDNNVYCINTGNANVNTPYTGSNGWTLYRMRHAANKHVFFKGGGQAEVDLGLLDDALSPNWRIQDPFGRDHAAQDPVAATMMGEVAVTTLDQPTDDPAGSAAMDAYLQKKWNVTY